MTHSLTYKASSIPSPDDNSTRISQEVEGHSEYPGERENERVRRQGAVQLANAIITSNSQGSHFLLTHSLHLHALSNFFTEIAVHQILSMYKNSIDLDYVDHKHGHPLTSLAILAGQAMIAIQLLERGASPFKRNNSGRTVLYIATESGIASVVRHIIKIHPELDLNQPVTSEIQRYCCIHVSITYQFTDV